MSATVEEIMSIMVDFLREEGIPMDRKPRQKVLIVIAQAQEDGHTLIVKTNDGTYYAADMRQGNLVWVPIITLAQIPPGRVLAIPTTEFLEGRLVHQGTSTVQ